MRKHDGALLGARSLGLLFCLSLVGAPAAVAGCMKVDGDGWYFEPNAALCPGYAGAPQSHFTSIAVSDSTGDWGDSWSASTRGQADQSALADCAKRATDCKIDMWAQGECIALAMAADNSWGVGSGPSRYSADADAMNECRTVTKDACAIQADPCSEDSP